MDNAHTNAGLAETSATGHEMVHPEARAFPLMRRTLFNAFAMGIGEAVALVGCLMIGGVIRYFWKGDPMFASWMWILVLAWFVGATLMKLLPGWGLGPVEELRRTCILLVSVFAGTIAMLFWGKQAEQTSRFVLTTGFLLSMPILPLIRTQVKRFLINRGAWGLPTAIYASHEDAPRIIEALREEGGLGYVPTCVFTDDSDRTAHEILGIPIVGRMDQHSNLVPAAILAMPGMTRTRAANILEEKISFYRKVLVIPELLDAPSLWVIPRDLVGMLGLEITSNLLDPFARVVKRTFDLTLVTFTAPLWLPLCLVLSLLVWVHDRKSPLFLQERVGVKGHLFKTFKFRTMRPDAEEVLARRLRDDEELRQEWESNFKLRDDPRITSIGNFLRRSSLDELPQLLNVIRGDMSLVGPRPLPVYHFEELPDRVKKLRDRVRPGITGLWQVSGRSESGHAGMPKWDTYYVRNWSIWLDLVIFFRTIRAVISRHGAY